SQTQKRNRRGFRHRARTVDMKRQRPNISVDSLVNAIVRILGEIADTVRRKLAEVQDVATQLSRRDGCWIGIKLQQAQLETGTAVRGVRGGIREVILVQGTVVVLNSNVVHGRAGEIGEGIDH